MLESMNLPTRIIYLQTCVFVLWGCVYWTCLFIQTAVPTAHMTCICVHILFKPKSKWDTDANTWASWCWWCSVELVGKKKKRKQKKQQGEETFQPLGRARMTLLTNHTAHGMYTHLHTHIHTSLLTQSQVLYPPQRQEVAWAVLSN